MTIGRAVKAEIPYTSRRPRRAVEHLFELETARSNINGPASGFRARKEFPYSSKPARSSRKP
jgi:hypothetical protein